MDEQKKVQADKRGKEYDVEDELISGTEEITESIKAIKKESPEARDHKAINDSHTQGDETELKTGTKRKGTYCKIDDTDSYDTKGMYKING